MNKRRLTGLIFLISLSSFGQTDAKRANFWHFGKNAGLDFTCSPPVSFSGSMLNSSEGSASISDINGNLLMYTDGVTVWDRNNNVMPNGTGLKGSQSTVQTAVFVPCFGNPDKYFIFTAGTSIEDQGVNGVCFSEIDMTLNGGFGDVIAATKNTLLFQPNEEKLTAVANAANNGYWVVAQEKSSNVWYAYEVTTFVNTTPVISTTGPPARIDNSLGAKLSPDGSLLATQNVCGSGASSNVNFCLYSFNNTTGQINFLWNDCGTPGFKIEFSPDNTKLYVSGGPGLSQYDLTSGGGVTDGTAIIASKTLIGASVDVLQLANDCKIYTGKNGTTQIGVIDDPNVAGTGCNYIPNYMALSSGLVIARYPNFIQSFFRGPCTNLDFDLVKTDAHCQSDGTITLNLYTGIPPVTYLWSNGATTQNLSNLSGGMYTVTVTDGRGCTKMDSIFVDQPASAAVTSAIIVNPSACGSIDGSIDLTIDLVGGIAQNLITESFETNGEGTRYVTTNGENTAFNFFKNDVDAGFSFTGGAPTGEDGTHYYGCKNPTTSPSILTINSTSITGYTSLNACILLACNRISYGSTDNIKFQYRINGGAWTQLAAFYSTGSFPITFAEDTDGDNVGDGIVLGSAFQDFCYAIPGTGNTIQLRVVLTSTSSQSQFAFDNIRLEGIPPNSYTVLWNTGTMAGATTEDIAGLPAESDSVTITTSSGCVVGANFVLVDPCSTLPIMLSELSAICNGNDVLLNWTTFSEQNSYKYYVEKRRGDGSWSVIGFVLAAGNSNTPINYSVTDINGAGELSYYRLRLVDLNGGGEVFNPISISCDNETNNIIVFPNPTNGSFTVQISSTKAIDGAIIRLMDVAGKLIASKTVTIVEGVTQVLFDNTMFASGMYVVKVYGGNKVFKPVKIVKN